MRRLPWVLQLALIVGFPQRLVGIAELVASRRDGAARNKRNVAVGWLAVFPSGPCERKFRHQRDEFSAGGDYRGAGAERGGPLARLVEAKPRAVARGHERILRKRISCA